MADTLVDIKAALKAVLEGVTNMGKVHDRVRWTNEPAKFKELFFDDSKQIINGWEITRVAYAPILSVSSLIHKVHVMRCRGYYGFKDSIDTENKFQTIVDGVVDAIHSNISYTDAWDRIEDMEGAQAVDIGLDDFAGHICHYADVEVRLEVRSV
jgi:hypothetical protein